jgi:hypothetical protein
MVFSKEYAVTKHFNNLNAGILGFECFGGICWVQKYEQIR